MPSFEIGLRVSSTIAAETCHGDIETLAGRLDACTHGTKKPDNLLTPSLCLCGHQTSTSMSGPLTRTLYRFTARPGGGPSTSPVVTSKTPPCQGQVTSTPLSSPSQSGPPTCVQVLSIARNDT